MTRHRHNGSKRERSRLAKAASGKFGFLLLSLIGLLLLGPLLLRGVAWALAMAAFSGGVMMAGLYAARPSRRSLWIGLGLAATDVVIGRLLLLEGQRWLVLVEATLWLSTLTYVTLAILDAIFVKTMVDIESLQASLCVYLLFGLIWVYIYSLIEMLAPGSFQPQDGAPPLISWTDAPSRRAELVRLFVFSYSTLAMTGFGAMAPTTAFARMCICLEVMSAQVYLAVVIARLVGMQAIEKEEGEKGEATAS